MNKYTLDDIKFAIYNLGQFYKPELKIINLNTKNTQNQLYTLEQIPLVISDIINNSQVIFDENEAGVIDNFNTELTNVFKAIDYVKNNKVQYFEDVENLYKILVKNTFNLKDPLFNNKHTKIQVNDSYYQYDFWDNENILAFKKDFKKNIKTLQGLSNIYTSIVTLQPFSNANKRIANLIAFSYFYHNKKVLKLNGNQFKQCFSYILSKYPYKAPSYLDIKDNIPNINFDTFPLTNKHKNKLSNKELKEMLN